MGVWTGFPILCSSLLSMQEEHDTGYFVWLLLGVGKAVSKLGKVRGLSQVLTKCWFQIVLFTIVH